MSSHMTLVGWSFILLQRPDVKVIILCRGGVLTIAYTLNHCHLSKYSPVITFTGHISSDIG